MLGLAALIVFPVLLISLVAIRYGLRPLYTLSASVVGEALAVLFVAASNHSNATLIVFADSSRIGTRTTAPEHTLVKGVVFLVVAVAIAGSAQLANWIYIRARSA